MLQLTSLQPEHMPTMHIDATLNAGECWAIVGLNGSGKTTLLETLAGLRTASSGQVCLLGQDIHHMPPRHRARLMATLLQQAPNRFPETVFNFVKQANYALCQQDKESNQAIWQSLRQVALMSQAKTCITHLSGGQWQRARIARLLTQDPMLYLFDEPLTHIDIPHQIAIMRLLRHLARQGACVICVCHDMNLVTKFCTHVILLEAQEPAIVGNIETLSESSLSRALGCRASSIETSLGQQWVFSL